MNTTRVITGVDEAGNPATVTVSTVESDPAPPTMLVGVDCDPAAYGVVFATFPHAQVTRVFCKPGEGILPWTHPRIANVPPGVLVHLSYKDWASDQAATVAVTAWLDTMPAALESVALTWHHEPEGDDVTAVEYQRRWGVLADVVRSHPNGNRVTLVPIQTMYWTLAAHKGNGNPFIWWAGAGDVAGMDCYATLGKDYPDPADFLRAPLALARGVGKQLWVPELGAQLVASDTDGAGRAAWITEVLRLLRESGCAAVSWWHQPGKAGRDYTLTDRASADAWAAAT